MSDTVIGGNEQDFLIDGEMPRLGAAPPHPMMIAAQPMAPTGESVWATVTESFVESEPTSPGGLPSPRIDAVPVLTSLTGPSLPTPALVTDEPKAPASDPDAHPMAHLMPSKAAPNEASKRAAEARAAKKAKSRRIKIGVGVGAIVVGAVVGPPLGRWFVDALNEAGNTKAPAEAPAD